MRRLVLIVASGGLFFFLYMVGLNWYNISTYSGPIVQSETPVEPIQTGVIATGKNAHFVHIFSDSGSTAQVRIEGSLDGQHWFTVGEVCNPDREGQAWGVGGIPTPLVRVVVTSYVAGTIHAVTS